jgi:hypothetical protein
LDGGITPGPVGICTSPSTPGLAELGRKFGLFMVRM